MRFNYLFKIKKRIAGTLDHDILSITQKGVKIKDIQSGDGQLSMDYSKYQIVQQGDFAMNHMDLLTGFVDISNYQGVTSPDYRVFSLEDRSSCDKYFLYILQLCYIEKIFYPLGRGAAQIGRWRLPAEAFKNFVTPYPPQNEQQQIANFLDHETAKIDTLIEKQQQLIKLLGEKRQAVISHAVTKGLNPNAPMKDSGVEWLGKVPKHWDVKRIKNLSTTISKGTTPSTIGGDFVDKGIRFLKAENIGKSLSVSLHPVFFITDEVDAQLERSRLKENDVLVIIAGATTGLASIVSKDILPANTNQAVSFIRPIERQFSKLIVRWLSTNFAQRKIWMGAVQAAQPNLSMEDLGEIPIAVPPRKELDKILITIDDQLVRFGRLTMQAELAIRLMQERRTALISAAVTGKIDVRNWQAPTTTNPNKNESTKDSQ